MKVVSLSDLSEEEGSHPGVLRRVMLARGDLPHATFFSQARFLPGRVVRSHKHDDMWEIFFVESGTGLIRVDGSEHALAPGVCVVVEPGEAHEVHNTTNEDLVLTYFGVSDGAG